MMKSDMSYCRKTAVEQVISDFLFHCQYEKNLNEKTIYAYRSDLYMFNRYIQEAKNIRLVDFLAGFGHEPVIQRGNSVWYKSPFRTEKEASFKVDLHKELWYDFGLGKGGDIITLAKEIYQTQDVSRVLRCIEDKRTVLKPVTVSCPFEK